MAVRVGINGFGRIGRNFYRAARRSGADIDLVAVNDLTSPEINAHLLKYDSTHGILGEEVKVTGDGIAVGSDSFKVLSERDPKALPWGDLGVDVVLCDPTGPSLGAVGVEVVQRPVARPDGLAHHPELLAAALEELLP